MIKFKNVDERSISNKNATMLEVIVGSLSLLFIILMSTNLDMHWSLTLSFCIFYATNLQRSVMNLLNSIRRYVIH